MKPTSILVATFGISNALWVQQVPIAAPTSIDEESLQVPGDNPLFYCASPADYILTIENLDLSPNPPEQGKNLTIQAIGQLSETIKDGSKAHITVKWGFVSLINKDFDLCENANIVDKKCPLEKGAITITKDIAIPNPIPPGNYEVTADVFTNDVSNGGKRVTCLTGSMQF